MLNVILVHVDDTAFTMFLINTCYRWPNVA